MGSAEPGGKNGPKITLETYAHWAKDARAERFDMRFGNSPDQIANELMGVLTISSLISLGMMANMSLMDRSEMASIEVMDELIKPLFWKFTSVAYVGFTYGSIIISFFSFVLCIGIMTTFYDQNMHKDDCLSASAFRWQFKNEFMLQYYLILISVISGAASTAMLALSRIPMGPCSMEVFEAGGVDYSHCDDQMTSAHYVWLTISFFWIGVAMFGGYWFIREGLRFRLRFMNIQLGHNYENAPPPTMGKLVHRMAQVSQRSLRGVRTQPGREPEAKGATEMPADGA